MEASARSVEQQDESVKEIKSRPLIASIILVAGTILLALSMAVSISFGAADISLKTVWQAVFQFDGSITHHNVIQELRMPRAIGGRSCRCLFSSIRSNYARYDAKSTCITIVNGDYRWRCIRDCNYVCILP